MRSAGSSRLASRPIPTLRSDADRPQDIPLCWGKIHFLRRVAEDGTIRVLNEPFRAPRALAYDYVWAVIDTRREVLIVTHQPGPKQPAEIILHHSYAFRERARRRPPLRKG